MTIKQVLVCALRCIGREELAYYIDDGDDPFSEDEELVRTLLYCINATENELARYYFPLKFTQTLEFDGGEAAFSAFSHTPVRILSVCANGRKIEFTVAENGIKANCAQAEVTYHYLPKNKDVYDESEYNWLGDENITAYGAAAEFLLINGEPKSSEGWEKRYRDAIERALAKNRRGAGTFIPPRRWV